MAEPWAPALDDVARHIPTRTRDTDTPGSDELLGTFTPGTTPSDVQAQAVITEAVRSVLSQTGPLDSRDAELLSAARACAEWRAAADIELAYPGRDADVAVYQQLDARAKDEMAALMARLRNQSEGPEAEVLPAWSAPPAPPYADRDPGDFTRPRAPASWWGGTDLGPI